MKKLFLIIAVSFLTAPVFAQDIPIIGDTTDLKSHSVKQIVILQHFGGGDETGGGLFRRIDSTYAEGTHAFDYAALEGKQWVRMQYMGGEMGAFSDLSAVGEVDIAPVGAHTDNVIDFTDVTINYTGSSGPAWLRGGTYGTPVANADEDQSGMIRFYGQTSANGTSYDRCLFIALKTTGTKAIFPISGLAEILAQTGEGPTKAMAGQFIVGLHTATSKLDSSTGTTDGMFASWFKVYSASGSVADTTSRIAAIWLDNSMGGTVYGEHYSAFITNGGIKADAVFGLETGAGWDALFYFDETAYDQPPVSTMTPATQSNDADGSIIIDLNGTLYYIPYFGIGKD